MSGAYSGQRTEIFAASRRKGRGVGKTRWPSGIHRANVSLDAPLRVEARSWHFASIPGSIGTSAIEGEADRVGLDDEPYGRRNRDRDRSARLHHFFGGVSG